MTMVKKKRQNDPGDNGDDSTESCEESVKSACPHVAKAVDLSRLKKYLKIGAFEKECVECKKQDLVEALDPDYEIDLSLWMCLRCGSQLCGRTRNKHALNHFNTPHSDCHSLTANTTTWEVYCYICDNEVTASSAKKLHECIEYLKKQSSANCIAKPSSPIELPPPLENIIINTDTFSLKIRNKERHQSSSSRVRGLTNLGNTCFFNSVMQCLVQTPYLYDVLLEMANPGEKFLLPGGTLKIKESDSEEEYEIELPPISGELPEWGVLTKTLAETLSQLHSGEGGVYNPRKLLGALINKLPQFGGGDQHDAHELLRHLLEAVRSEDLRRYQSVILNSMGMSPKVDPAKVKGEIKQKVKFYGQQASDTMLRPEQVFRGFLVSTLECQDCLQQSEREEYFLDLSLPVAASRPQPPAASRRKTALDENIFNNTQEDHKPSKHQLKKERIAAKKAARKNKGGNSSNDNSQADASGPKDATKSSSEQSDADVEDNLEDQPRQPETIPTNPLPHTAANFAAYHMESGYNSEKLGDSIRTSPVELEKEKSDNIPERLNKDDNPIPLGYKPLISLENLSNPDSGVASPEATKHNSTETVDNVDSPNNGKELGSHSSLSSEINLDLSSPQQKLSPVKNDFERPVSRISFAPEYTNEVISRGISAQGGKNVLEHSSQESLVGSRRDELDELDLEAAADNAYSSMKSRIEKLSMDPDLEAKVARRTYPSPVAPDGPDPPPRPKVIDLDMDSNRRDFLPFSRPGTLSPRYIYDEDECSIQSCLSQFTALELLTGNNKVGCEKCTERINGKDGKTVYTNATKRFLVSSPPAILILHLKRFQIGPRCLFRKMSKHVDFPTVLDLAPFCAMDKVRRLPNANRGQNELLYSLYGVVEHSGGMHGGHYVAYVKVRAPINKNDPRWWFLPRGPHSVPADNGEGDASSDTSLSGYESGEAGGGGGGGGGGPPCQPAGLPRAGKWYYISDSMVSEVTEDKVLSAQAYVLFYERIV